MTVEALEREPLTQREIELGRRRRVMVATHSAGGDFCLTWMTNEESAPALGDVFVVEIEKKAEAEWDDEGPSESPAWTHTMDSRLWVEEGGVQLFRVTCSCGDTFDSVAGPQDAEEKFHYHQNGEKR